MIIKKLFENYFAVFRIGGQWVETPVRANLGLAPVTCGIKISFG